MNIFGVFEDRIAAILSSIASPAGGFRRISTSSASWSSRRATRATATSPATPPWSSPGRRSRTANPRAARRGAAGLAGDPDVASAEVAGPGFINISLKPAVFERAARRSWPGRPMGAASPRGEPVNVEYVSPTRPARCMSATGAAPCSATRSPTCWPFRVAGRPASITSTTRVRRSTCWRARRSFAIARRWARHRPDPRGALSRRLPQDPSARRWPHGIGATLLDQPEAEWLPLVRAPAIDAMMERIRDDLAALDIAHEVFFSERSLTGGSRPRRRGDRGLRRQGPDLPGPPAAAEGRAA